MSELSLGGLIGISSEEFASMVASPGLFKAREPRLSPAHIQSILTVDDFDNLVSTVPLSSPTIRVWRDGRKLPEESFTSNSGSDGRKYADTARIYRLFESGCTIVLRDLERYWAPATELSWNLTDELGRATGVGAFISPPNAKNLAPHFDYTDLILMQTHGSRTWHTYDENAALPLDANGWRMSVRSVDPTIPGTSYPSASTEMHPGEVALLSRGTSHAVQGNDSTSIHVVASIQATTYFDVCEEAMRAVSRSKPFRRSIEGRSTNSAIVEQAHRELQRLAQSIADDDFAWALLERSQRDVFEQPVSILRQMQALTCFNNDSNVVLRKHLVHMLIKHGDRTCIKSRGVTVVVPKCLVHDSELTKLLGGNVVCVNSLNISGQHSSEWRALLLALLKAGLAGPADERDVATNGQNLYKTSAKTCRP